MIFTSKWNFPACKWSLKARVDGSPNWHNRSSKKATKLKDFEGACSNGLIWSGWSDSALQNLAEPIFPLAAPKQSGLKDSCVSKSNRPGPRSLQIQRFHPLAPFPFAKSFHSFSISPKDNWSVLKSSFSLKLSSFAYPTPLLHRACCPQDSAYVQCAKLRGNSWDLLGRAGCTALVKPQLMRQVPLSSCT